MSCQIMLFNKVHEQLGVIRFNSDMKEISFDWNQHYSQEVAEFITSLLKKAHEERKIKARHEVLIEDKQGKNIRIQKIENVSINDPDFFAALTDRINRDIAFRSKIFAVLQKV